MRFIKAAIVSSACLLVGAAMSVPPSGAATTPPLTFSVAELLAIGNVDAPPAGTGLEIHADWPAEAPLNHGGIDIYSLTADITPEGEARVLNVVTAADALGRGPVGECEDPAYTPDGKSWAAEDLPVEWRFRRGSTPKGVSRWLTTVSLREAHRTWPQAHSRCKNAQPNSFRFDYTGRTTRSAKYDHKNVVEFARLGSGALATNYTWYTNNRILEVDFRFERKFGWSNNPKHVRRYQIPNVAAHELGHQVGLDDLSDPHGQLTMFGRIGRGETGNLTLGWGDIRGARDVSP